MTQVFGLDVGTSFPLPGLDDSGTELRLVRGDAASRFSGSRTPAEVGRASVWGLPWTVERGTAGDLLMRWGQARAVFHLDDGMLTALGAPEDLAWQRVLLDSGLTTAALHRGYEALHAAAVAVDGGVLAVAGRSGAGKTSLLGEFLRRGLPLVCDDVLVVDGGGCAYPGPPLVRVAAPAHGGRLPGRVVARFGDASSWVVVASTAPGPLPLRRVVVLDRSGPRGTPARLDGLPSAALLGLALDSGGDPARRTARLTCLAAVAGTVRIERLVAGADATPAALADTVLAA